VTIAESGGGDCYTASRKSGIPTAARRQAGLNKGDLVNFAFQRGKIVMTPKLVIDGSRFPAADDEYTPAQRRIIDASLARADADIKAGRVSKVFSDHAEFIAALHKEAAKLSAKSKTPGQMKLRWTSRRGRRAKGAAGPRARMTKRTQLEGNSH
jgi:hypothetical protein